MAHLPSSVASAVADPKCASDSALLSTLKFYSDSIADDDLEMVSEEFERRGGDPDYVSTVGASSYEMYL
jgi:hypothetical protein